ncbi:MAG TPA: Orn/Lys/Arg decarboxylase N-terminal domain-containing protein, partial [Gemmatimonadales bacterium]|nr:Orn/Lys/Arg decarboxylase N-terminal domain-containing protein [Gemmatimonadales bacterium]
MITSGSARPLTRRVLIIDDKLNGANTAGGRSVRALADELRERGIDVVVALSIADGFARVVSDSALHGIFLSWTMGKANGATRDHTESTHLLRTLRARNPKVPVFLMADRSITGTVTVEVATLVDEFIWILEDTAAFIGGRA